MKSKKSKAAKLAGKAKLAKGSGEKVLSKAELTSASDHAAALDRLKDQDPEFYKFLQTEDAQLLDFDLSDDELPEDDQEVICGDDLSDDDIPDPDFGHEDQGEDTASDDEGDNDTTPAVLNNSKRLDMESDSAAEESDDSDSEGEDEPKSTGRTTVTNKLVDEWQEELVNSPSITTVGHIVNAFEAAIERSGAEGVHAQRFVVHETDVFNSIVRLAFTQLPTVFARALQSVDDDEKETKAKDKQHGGRRGQNAPPGIKFKNWTKYKRIVRKYLQLLTIFLAELQESGVTLATLRHAHSLANLITAFPKLTKKVLKLLIRFWSRAEEVVRVQAFVNIIKLVGLAPKFAPLALRLLYTSFVNNARSVTTETWPNITFMQASLTEFVLAHPAVAYQYVFVYIRQMAIHLRNANIARKTELVLAVYNWQYVQCLYLWCRVLSAVHARLAELDEEDDATYELYEPIDELRYPLVQVVLGTARLINSPRYYPLRVHCLRALHRLCSTDTQFYVPVVPIITDMLASQFLQKPIESAAMHANKKAKKGKRGRKDQAKETAATLKPINIDCLLKVSKSAQSHPQFKHALIEALQEQLIRFIYSHCCHMSFPETSVLIVEQLRQFTRTCKVMSHTAPMRELLPQIQTQVKWLNERRDETGIDLTDNGDVMTWTSIVRGRRDESPFGQFYTVWHRSHMRQLAVRRAQLLADGDEATVDSDDDGEPMDVHEGKDDDSDDKDSDDDEEEVVVKPKKAKKTATPKVKKEKRENRRDPIDLSFLTTLNVGKNDNVQDLVFSDED